MGGHDLGGTTFRLNLGGGDWTLLDEDDHLGMYEKLAPFEMQDIELIGYPMITT